MPQIARQDYIKAVATPGRVLEFDCNVFSVVAKALEAGTLFDVLIVYDEGGLPCQVKILGYDANLVYYFDAIDGEVKYLSLVYSPAQYAALSAIQLGVDRIDETPSGIPKLVAPANYLAENVSGYPICNPAGYKYAVTASSGNIATISVSDELAEGDIIVLDEETAQDLIGLPIQ